MNYRQETYILLSKKAVEKMTPEVKKILYGNKAEHVILMDDAKVFAAQYLTLDEDIAVSEWLDTLDVDKDEIFEVIARGHDIYEIEHISNTLAEDRLSVEFHMKADGIDLVEVIPEGGD